VRHHRRVKFTHRPNRDPLGIQDSRLDHLGRDDTGRVTTQGTDAKKCSLHRIVRTTSLLFAVNGLSLTWATCQRGLFRGPKFVLLLLGWSIATFPLLVPPFFIPLYANSVGASAALASGLLAIFNLASVVGRVGFKFGMLSDFIGPISSPVLALAVNALSMLAIWPVSSIVAPLVVFIVVNGIGSGGFFSRHKRCR